MKTCLLDRFDCHAFDKTTLTVKNDQDAGFFTNLLILLLFTTFPAQIFASECPYPGDPINWIMRYCAYKLETGDEISIQKSPCYKDAEKEVSIDKKNRDFCEIKRRYKLKFCTESYKEDQKYKNAQDCLKDSSIEPFFAGG